MENYLQIFTDLNKRRVLIQFSFIQHLTTVHWHDLLFRKTKHCIFYTEENMIVRAPPNHQSLDDHLYKAWVSQYGVVVVIKNLLNITE